MPITTAVVDVSTHPHGALSTLTETELEKSATVRAVGEKASKAEKAFRLAVIALKMEMDANDPNAGGHGDHSGSRFWNSAREGQHGPYLQEMVESGNRMTVQRWLKYEKAATELLVGVTRVTPDSEASSPLATAEALDRGLSFRVLESFSGLPENAKSAARLMFQERDKVSQHAIEQIGKLYRDYPQLDNKLCEGITSGEITRQKDIELLMEQEREARIRAEAERDKAVAEADAARRALETARDLERVDTEEHQLATQREETKQFAEAATARPVNTITKREARPRSYYESDKGKLEVARVLGDIPDLMPVLGENLNQLEKDLKQQFDHYAVMHNYREFMAGYDAYFYSEKAAAKRWGKGGRLERLKKLQDQLKYLTELLGNYIGISTPEAGTIYPD